MTQKILGSGDQPVPSKSVASVPARGLVFVGFRIQWRKQIGDLDFNAKFAEGIESEFDHWSIDDRVVHLGELGYALNLADGYASFAVDSPGSILSVAKDHAQSLIAALVEAGRARISISAEAQYLEPVEDSTFDTLLKKMSDVLHNPAFVSALGAELTDIAYMSDIRLNGQWFQLSIGPVRAHEIPGRVAGSSRRFGQIPPLAKFYSVTSRASLDGSQNNLETFWNNVLALGDSIKDGL